MALYHCVQRCRSVATLGQGLGAFKDDTIAADSFFAGPPSEPDNKGPSSWSWVNVYRYFLSFFFRPLFVLQLLSRSLLSSQIRKHGKPSTWRRTEVSLQSLGIVPESNSQQRSHCTRPIATCTARCRGREASSHRPD
jgi:hypothetical protein